MSRRHVSFGRAALLVLAASALSASEAAHGAPAPAGRSARIVPLEGEPLDGLVVDLTADALVLEGRPAPLPLAEVREARFAPEAPLASLPEGEAGLRVVLRGGETVRGTLVSGSEDGIVMRPLGLAEVRLSFDAIRRIETEAAARALCDEPARHRPPRTGTDVAWVRSGDAHAGTLARAGAAGVVLANGKDERSIAWGDLVVLHVDEPELPPAEGLVAEVDTTGGTRWIGAVASWKPDGIAVKTRSGLEVSVPRESLAAIRWTGGRFVFASDLPFQSKFTPYYPEPPREKDAKDGKDEKDAKVEDPAWLGAWFGARVDRTGHGCPLRIAGTTYRHGIAVHARSAVTIPLGKAYSRFEAKFGIDDEGLVAPEGLRGDVTARVLVDGREVWTSGGSVKGGEPARSIGPIDVSGVEALVLEVDFGEAHHTNDRADWVDPVLVRAK